MHETICLENVMERDMFVTFVEVMDGSSRKSSAKL
jgi:hypothetical protein